MAFQDRPAAASLASREKYIFSLLFHAPGLNIRSMLADPRRVHIVMKVAGQSANTAPTFREIDTVFPPLMARTFSAYCADQLEKASQRPIDIKDGNFKSAEHAIVIEGLAEEHVFVVRTFERMKRYCHGETTLPTSKNPITMYYRFLAVVQKLGVVILEDALTAAIDRLRYANLDPADAEEVLARFSPDHPARHTLAAATARQMPRRIIELNERNELHKLVTDAEFAKLLVAAAQKEMYEYKMLDEVSPGTTPPEETLGG